MNLPNRYLWPVLIAGFSASAFAQTEPSQPASPEAPIDCAKKYDDLAPVAIKLPYWEFDQTEQGWRGLGNCYAQQAQLLKRYAKRQEYEQRNVRWHLAQALALQGEDGAAAEQAVLAVNPDEATQSPGFSWNTYVLATAAFLRKDRRAFDVQHEAHRRATEASPRNALNLKVLDGLAACFDKPYREAYGKCVGPQ